MNDRFADIQLLRYVLRDFDRLTLQQKLYIYHLSRASLFGRDIVTDQFGAYNLRIRKTLEAVFEHYGGDRKSDDFINLTTYLKQVWFANGIYHHYGCEKFTPAFSLSFFCDAVEGVPQSSLSLMHDERRTETVGDLLDSILPVMFDPDILPMKVNRHDGEDLVTTSACNYYDNVTQREAEEYYAALRRGSPGHASASAGQIRKRPSYGLNTKLVKHDGVITEEAWTTAGVYGPALQKIVTCLEQATIVAENAKQQRALRLLINYYRTGDITLFDDFSIEWLNEREGDIDFINGFIEVYSDPLGIKGSWEGLVMYKDIDATRRTQTISREAQWFENHSPVDDRFKKKHVRGVTANVVCAAMLGGDEYPASAIGINLPNADWIRQSHGSKSVTIGNLIDSYNKAARGTGAMEEFVIDEPTLRLIKCYGNRCETLHTDLHECLGHGSGQLLPDVSSNSLGAYGSTIEEARADLFALYFLADGKLLELGLLDNGDAYKAQYYTYIMNGLLTQLVRIRRGRCIEEDHMRSRALIARYVLAHNNGAVELIRQQGKTFVRINDYAALRQNFALLLAEIQRIKSTGDQETARSMVERYAVNVDSELHKEIIERYTRLDIAPYKGFINPWLKTVIDGAGRVRDICPDYTETYEHQMLRYSKQYGTL